MMTPTQVRQNRFRIRFLWLVSMPLDQLRSLPRVTVESAPRGPGVYLFWHGPMLAYVGMSDCVQDRLAAHRSRRWQVGIPSAIGIVPLPTTEDALGLEAMLIERFRPKRNGRRERGTANYTRLKFSALTRPYSTFPFMAIDRATSHRKARAQGNAQSAQSCTVQHSAEGAAQSCTPLSKRERCVCSLHSPRLCIWAPLARPYSGRSVQR